MITLRLRTFLFFGLTIAGLMFTVVMTFNTLAHGGDETAVHACVSDSSGVPRIVDANDDCRNRETPLDLVSGDAAGLSGVEKVSAVVSLPSSGIKIVSQLANCPVGKIATGGSFKLLSDTGNILPGAFLVSDFPVGDPPTAWEAIVSTQIQFGNVRPQTLEVFAICATGSP